MLLRSSSTPVLGSLLPSFSESPNNHHHYYQPEVTLTPNRHPPIPPTHNKVSFHRTAGPQNFTTFSSSSSPVSPSINNGFRRAHSEGNLESLARSSSNDDEYSFSKPPKKFLRKPNSSSLETIPSFSFHNSRSRYEDDYSDFEEEEEEEEEDEYGDSFGNAIRGEERFEAANFSDLNTDKKFTSFNEEIRYGNDYGNVCLKEETGKASSQMYLARGLGVDIDFGSGGAGGNFPPPPVAFGNGRGGGGGDSHGVEEHFKRMVNENPNNSLFLRNYAQFLYQSKQDLQGAEDYYSRAILADPKDGESYHNMQNYCGSFIMIKREL